MSDEDKIGRTDKPKLKSAVAVLQEIFRRWKVSPDRRRKVATLKAVTAFDSPKSKETRHE